MNTDKKTEHQTVNRVSNITGGITDEEFAGEFFASPTGANRDWARYQFNFLGADLEKINSAKNIRDELKNR